MTHTVFIDGAAGTTGLEIADRLAERDEFTLLTLDEATRKDPVARREALNMADFAILCLPDDAAREAVSMVSVAGKTRVIDASSAHRTASGWTYGFPEIVGRKAIEQARFVSNPGCYPTGFLALVAPLVASGHLSADWPYTVNAVSGYSGGGKALIERFEAAPEIAFRSYGLALGHKHVAEMQRYAGLAHAPVFSPSVVHAHRGMIVDVPLPLAAMGKSIGAAELRAALAAYYDGSAIVKVLTDQPAELLLEQGREAWDGLELWVTGDEGTGQARLLARLDNLGKGASGAAIQSLNIMAGLPETTGLRLPNF